MHRYILIAAAAVVLLAVGAVIAVGVMRSGGEQEPADEAPPTRNVVDRSPVVEGDGSPFSNVRRPPTRSTPTTMGGPGDFAMGGGGDGGEPVDDERVASLVTDIENLSDQQRRQLMGELGRRDRERRALARRYEMPTDRRLRRLTRNRDENLRLTEAQQQQISAIHETYKPQMDTVLADVWAQQAETREQAMELMRSGQQAEARELFGQMRELGTKSNELIAPLEAQYNAQVNAILTPEQVEVMAQEGNDEGDRRGDRRRGGGFGSAGGNPGGGRGN